MRRPLLAQAGTQRKGGQVRLQDRGVPRTLAEEVGVNRGFLNGWMATAVALAAGCGVDPPDLPAAAADAPAGDASAGVDAPGPVDVPAAIDGHHLRLSLGTLHTGSDGRSPPLPFDVPPQTTSLAITVRGPLHLRYTLASLHGPGGASVVPPNWLDAGAPWLCLQDCPNRVASAPGAAAFLVPNTPLLTLKPGPHILQAYAFAADIAGKVSPAAAELTVHVDLVRRSLPAGPGRIDINLCLANSYGYTAAIALKHPRIVAAREEVAQALAQAGLALGDVRAFDVPAPSFTIEHDGADDAETSELFASGAGLPMGINVFLIDGIYRSEGPGSQVPLAGLSGGVPGPPLAVGGPRSGVALPLPLMGSQPDRLGRVMAHEICHFLGLFHTSEQPQAGESRIHDTLPDTGEDDADNLMHWQPTTGAGKLTQQQRQILQASPWVVPQP